MSEPAIKLNDITVAYDRHPRSITFPEVCRGSMTAIAGPNGAGKSTLLKAIMGESSARPKDDRSPACHSDFGYLPQAADINRRFPISVLTPYCSAPGGRAVPSEEFSLPPRLARGKR